MSRHHLSAPVFAAFVGLVSAQVSQHKFPTQGPQPGTMQVVRAFPGISFVRPVFLCAAPDESDRIFVVEQGGKIYVFPNSDTATAPKVFLDISTKVSRVGNEEGLLGLAFDPNYKTNGFFYVSYVTPTPRTDVVARYSVSTTDPDKANAASELSLTRVSDPYSNHNGGMLAFGPDGMLYIGMGDGGSGGDPNLNGQNKNTLLAKILRIDPRQPQGTLNYTIPPDNPFVGQPNTRGEIWCYGMRNPWRFSFDRQTGTLWCGDVGQDAHEEIDIIKKGGNFGWNVYEGSFAYRNPSNLPPTAFDQPLLDYPISVGRCVIGGYVYRGAKLTTLRGAYIYGDYSTASMWALVRNAQGGVQSNTLIGSLSGLCSFGEDQAGELFMVSQNGGIWRLQYPSGPPPAFPQKLSTTGLFTDVTTLTPDVGVLPYEVNHPLWSDGADKKRWIALPNGKFTFDASSAWTFPTATVLVKHFEIETVQGVPSSRKRLETRVLVNEQDGWAGYTYRWNAAGTDADLLADRQSETITIRDQNNQVVRTQTWNYPSRTECMQCHTAAEGRVLGVRTRQLNRTVLVNNQPVNQLEDWNARQIFSTDIGSASQYQAYPALLDTLANVHDRARAYLAVNCAMCHQPGGTAPTNVDLRWTTPDAAMGAFDVRPTAGDLGLSDAYVIKSNAKASSVLWERMRRTDTKRMPALGSTVVHDDAVAVLGQWIGAPFTAFGAGCPGAVGVPALAPAQGSEPRLGLTLQLQVTSVPAGNIVALAFGASKDLWGTTPLPLDLSFLTMNGCSLFVSPEVLTSAVANGGLAEFPLLVPNDPALLGQKLYTQGFVQDPSANLLGVSASNAGESIVIR